MANTKRFSVSLLWVKTSTYNGATTTDQVLRVSIVSSREALGLFIEECRKTVKGYNLSLYVVLEIPDVEPDSLTTN